MKNPTIIQRIRNSYLKKDLGNDPGFGEKIFGNNTNLLNPDGSMNIDRVGGSRRRTFSVYQSLITLSWWKLISFILIAFVFINFGFACIYYIFGVEHIGGDAHATHLDQLIDAFFLSAQTLTTVGYGRLNPTGVLSSLVAAFEALFGLLLFAIATGLIYGRFSRPDVKLKFSNNILITPYQNITALMFRFLNERSHNFIELEAKVMLSFLDTEQQKRRYHILELERDKVSILATSWTVVHPITEDSPFAGLSPEYLHTLKPEIIVNIKGHDEMYNQTVFARYAYNYENFVFGAKFKPILSFDEGQPRPTLYMDKISVYEKADLPY